jgi:flagellar hook-associated protein 3 FlgL
MTRITSSASNTILISRFLQTQKTLLDLETQVSTEKRTQVYSGLSQSSQRLLNIENAKATLQRFNSNNEQAQLRLDIQSTAVNGIRDAIKDFRELLLDFSNGDLTDPERVEQIQSDAFRALKNIQNLLNTEADGRYIFGGGTIRTEPVSFGLSTVSAFQSIYDGARVTFPTTREAHLENFSISRSSVNLDPAHLTFEQTDAGTGKSRINTTAASGQFQNIAAGTTITISGTVGGVNDGTYTVDSVDPNGLWIDVRTEQLTNEGTTAAPIFAQFSYPDPDDPRSNLSFSAEATFDRRTNTITAINTNALADIPEGSIVTISGTTNNNGSFTVASNDGTDLVIESQRFVSDGGANSTLETLGGANPLTFSVGTGANGEDQIIANTGTFGTLEAGQRIKINNTNTENDGKTFTVQSVVDDGATNVTITLASDESLDATIGTVTAGVVSLNARPFAFNPAERNFYFDADAVAASADTITFTDGGAGQDTITLNGSSFTDAKGNLLPAGTRITVTNAGANNGTYTIESISANGLTATLVATDNLAGGTAVETAAVLAGSGSITYADNAPSADTITLGGGYFRDLDGNNLPAGTRITFAGTTGGLNDNTYTIASVSSDGRTATLIPTDAVDDTTPTQTAGTISVGGTVGTISATSYYKGDTSTQVHRVSESQSFNFDITGIDPAFEKAIRGMFLVLQGKTGSEGGLDRNQNRVSEGLYLMDDALDRTNNKPPPFGTELNSNIEEMEIILGYRAVLINDVRKSNEAIIASFDGSISSIENIDPLEAITKLLDTQRTLEASYQTFARVRQLSLSNFL